MVIIRKDCIISEECIEYFSCNVPFYRSGTKVVPAQSGHVLQLEFTAP